jgi:hypothetical protein
MREKNLKKWYKKNQNPQVLAEKDPEVGAEKTNLKLLLLNEKNLINFQYQQKTVF